MASPVVSYTLDDETVVRFEVEVKFGIKVDYQAVIGLVGQAQDRGDGRAFTHHVAISSLPEQDLSRLADAYGLQACGADAATAWGGS